MMILVASLVFAFSANAGSNEDFLLSQELITLKPSSVVTDNHIKLGDIFNGLSENSNKDVAISPNPGEQLVLDARQLYRIARALNVDWRPISLESEIIISRASHIVKNNEIEEAVTDALRSKDIDDDAEIVFNTRDLEIHTPADVIASLVVKELLLDASKRRFSATVDIVADETSYGNVRISGQIFPVTLVPVLNETISSGTIIKDNYLALESVRTDQIKSNTLIDKKQIIGMEAKKNLRKGSTIQTNEIDRPLLVNRNQLVSIVFNTPSMNLTAKGQAKESGSEGDLIKVVNTRSNKTIQARITSEATVVVDTL